MIKTRPWRFTTRQCWQIFLTDAFTFMARILVAPDDAGPTAVWVELQRHTVADQDLDPVQTHFAGKIRKDTVPAFELHAKKGVRKRLINDAFDNFGFGHIDLRVQQ